MLYKIIKKSLTNKFFIFYTAFSSVSGIATASLGQTGLHAGTGTGTAVSAGFFAAVIHSAAS